MSLPSPTLFREGTERVVPGSPSSVANVESLLRELDNTPIVREPPMVPNGTFVVADGVSDSDFLMHRLGMAPPGPNGPVAEAPKPFVPPSAPPPQQPQHSMLQRPQNAEPEEKPPAKLTPEQEYSRKVELLWYLRKLRSAAEGPIMVNMNSPLYQIEAEVAQLRKEQMLEDGLESCKFGFLFCTSLIEQASTKPPINRFGVNLQGWSKKMMLDLEVDRRYAQVFTELVEKYRSKIPAGPEATLLYLMVSSAFTFSMASKLTDAALANVTPMPQTMKAAAAHIQQQQQQFQGQAAQPVVSLPQPPVPPPGNVDPAQMANILRLLQDKKQQSNIPPLHKKEKSRSGRSSSSSSSASSGSHESYSESGSSRSGSSKSRSSGSSRSGSSGSSSGSSVVTSSSGSGSRSGSSASGSTVSSEDIPPPRKRKAPIPRRNKRETRKRSRRDISSSEEESTESESDDSVREAELIRRSLPKHTKHIRRTSVTDSPTKVVPVVDVALQPTGGPVNPILSIGTTSRGRGSRGGRRGRGAVAGGRSRIQAAKQLHEDATGGSEKAPSEKAPSTRGSVKGGDESGDELDMTGF